MEGPTGALALPIPLHLTLGLPYIALPVLLGAVIVPPENYIRE